MLILAAAGAFAIVIQAGTQTIERTRQLAVTHPDQVTISAESGGYSIVVHGHHPELFPDPGELSASMASVAVIVGVLLAAAVTRRLHDVGRSGLWGFLPAPFIIGVVVLLPKLIVGMTADPWPIGIAVGLASDVVFGLFAHGLLCTFLMAPGSPSENRFGPTAGL